MAKLNDTDLSKFYAPFLSSTTLKKHIVDMLTNSTQCKAILENINYETGEYRIVLQGILNNHSKVSHN